MKTLVIVTLSKTSELPAVRALSTKFGAALRIVTPLALDFAPEGTNSVWKVADTNKAVVEWTKRFLRQALAEPFDVLVKVDPDTVFKGDLPAMPDCDVAGDFRKAELGWVWLGACQYYRRSAIEKILADSHYIGFCMWQDIALARAVVRTGLRCYNMPEIDGWGEDPSAVVTHLAKTSIPRMPPGLIALA